MKNYIKEIFVFSFLFLLAFGIYLITPQDYLKTTCFLFKGNMSEIRFPVSISSKNPELLNESDGITVNIAEQTPNTVFAPSGFIIAEQHKVTKFSDVAFGDLQKINCPEIALRNDKTKLGWELLSYKLGLVKEDE